MKEKLWQIVKFSISSLVTWVAEYLFYSLLVFLLVDNVSVRLLYYIARVTMTIPQYIINRHLVFSKNQSVKKSAIEFFAMQIAFMFVAAEATHLLSMVVDLGEVLTPILVRVPVDISVFVLTFIIQKKWIFK